MILFPFLALTPPVTPNLSTTCQEKACSSQLASHPMISTCSAKMGGGSVNGGNCVQHSPKLHDGHHGAADAGHYVPTFGIQLESNNHPKAAGFR